jgi:Mg2+-importing ATPase
VGKGTYWSTPADETIKELRTTADGLTGDEAGKRLRAYGPNVLKPKKKSDPLALLLNQFKSPIILLLLFAALLSFYLGETTSSLIIFVIIFFSSLLGFWQEHMATRAVEELLSIVRVTAYVLRDGKEEEVPFDEIVPGDAVLLAAGDGIPGDCLLLRSRDLFVDEAVLTGESYPVEKSPGVVPADAPMSRRTNSLFMGTHVVSGQAKALIVKTGTSTVFGKISERLKLKPPEPEFERGVKRFGYLLMEVTTLLIISIFAINVYMARPVLESFIFSLALAVGLTPQLLPAIISINLAKGARRMADSKVIVKQLSSIENFGSMNVLYADKTGTITEGIVRVRSAVGIDGEESEKTLFYAYLNAYYETGFASPIDRAIRSSRSFAVEGYSKLDEVPYDFIRKRLSILVKKDGSSIMITKGSLQSVLEICPSAEHQGGSVADMRDAGQAIDELYDKLSGQGFRTLGVAYRDMGQKSTITKDDEDGMTFLGVVVLFDPPKPGIEGAIKSLKGLGVSLKVITGDNRLVAAHVGGQVGLDSSRVITGSDLYRMSDEALFEVIKKTDVFAEVEPNQKERIILHAKKAGNVVGFLGDGINDGPALHAADVGISVESAVDVAKEAAQIVLLEKDLEVLARGVEEGRKTFSNTLKYVFMATSANFGNMFSMAGASLILPFLPLLPTQILLTNLMTDFPEMTIATDRVDPELVDRPRRWNIDFIRKFMIMFGVLSSVFDYMTFGVLLFMLHADVNLFRTGWFMESVVSATMIVLVIRTRRSFWISKPSKYLFVATLAIIAATILLPYTPLAPVFQFQPLPALFIVVMLLIVAMYVLAAEVAKKVFYRLVKF